MVVCVLYLRVASVWASNLQLRDLVLCRWSASATQVTRRIGGGAAAAAAAAG